MPRVWGNLFVISRFCSIHFTVTLDGLENNYRSLYRGLRYIDVRLINRGSTVVCKLYYKDHFSQDLLSQCTCVFVP